MKNIQELRDAFLSTIQNGINFTIYLGVSSNTGLSYFQADLDVDSVKSLANAYLDSLKSWFEDDEIHVAPLSGIDQRDGVLYHYDITERPTKLSEISVLLGDQHEIFSFKHNDLSDIKSLVIKVTNTQNKFIFYKTVYPVAIVSQSSILMVKAGNRLQHLEKDILKITNGFDVLLYENEYYINGFKKFQKSFNFGEIERKIKVSTTTSIMALGICNDTKSHLANGVGPARDYIRVANSEVLSLSPSKIVAHAESLQSKTNLKITNGVIQLTSKKAVKLFLKLLNDDYLRSELTNHDYDTLAKNKM